MTIVVASPRSSSSRRVMLPDEFFVDDGVVDEEVPPQQQPERQKLEHRTTAAAGGGNKPQPPPQQQQQHRGQSIEWRDVCMNVKMASKKKKKRNDGDDNNVVEENKKILDHVCGGAKAGELSAIMGASGSGKTSLFNVLAGRVRSKGKVTVSADICLGGKKIYPQRDVNVRRALFAFVEQDDSLHIASTPRQALTFSARLRLPKHTTDDEITQIVERLIDDLGLRACCDTVIGGGFLKGISGGEKRRTSIGVELVSGPALIFLDEPTSGLDSFAARQVVTLLQSVARAGNTVLVTIHQPASNVFAMFDHLVLLHKGRVLHQGKVARLADDFATHNYPLPAQYNPADWILDVAQTHDVGELERAGFFVQQQSNNKFDDSMPDYPSIPSTVQAPLSIQLAMLLEREKIALVKDPASIIINASITAFLALIFGIIFYQVGAKERDDPIVVQSQLGAVVNILISTMFGQSQTALTTFPKERPMFIREYATQHYSVAPYFLSRLATESFQTLLAVLIQALIAYFMIGFRQTFWQFVAVTFSLAMTSTAVAVLLGSFFSDRSSAEAMFTLVIVPQMYFSGVFIAVNLIPVWVRWSQYLCSLTYGARLALGYEFGDPSTCTVSSTAGGGAAPINNCDLILSRNEVDPDDIWWYWLAMVGLFLGFRLGALTVLKQRADDFS